MATDYEKMEALLGKAGYIKNDEVEGPEDLGQMEFMARVTGRFLILALGQGAMSGDEGAFVNFCFHPSSGDLVQHSCGYEEPE